MLLRRMREEGICFFIKENVNICYTYRRIFLHSNYRNYTADIHLRGLRIL